MTRRDSESAAWYDAIQGYIGPWVYTPWWMFWRPARCRLVIQPQEFYPSTMVYSKFSTWVPRRWEYASEQQVVNLFLEKTFDS